MKKLFLALPLILILGCQGQKGDTGATGAQGPSQIPPVSSNQPVINEYDGQVGTGTALIGTSLHTNSAVLVYLESTTLPGNFVLLSVDPTTGPWAEISYTFAAVTFHNCGTTNTYKILVITPA